MKKLTVYLLILVMALSVFSGCEKEPPAVSDNQATSDSSAATEIDVGMDEAVAVKINDTMKKQVEDNLILQAFEAKFGKKIAEVYDVTFEVLGNECIFYDGIGYVLTRQDQYTEINISAIFDFKTGKILTFDDVLSEDWKNEIRWSDNKVQNINDLTLTDFGLDMVENYVTLLGYNKTDNSLARFYVPEKYLRAL
jgi:hypothetical protein